MKDETLSLQTMIACRWAVLTRICPEDDTGKRSNPGKFKRGLAALEKVIEDRAVATVKDREGELCYVVAIDEALYMDDREWLTVTYIKPSHGFTPYDWYCGSWLPAGIKLR